MEMKAVFVNGECKLVLTPASDWERKLLGALAQGQDALDAEVVYKPSGHTTYGSCQAIEITLRPYNTPIERQEVAVHPLYPTEQAVFRQEP